MTGRVVIVGGGISGLAAAWELSGAVHPQEDPPEIVLLEGSDRLGGMLRSDDFAGRVVDMGADGFLGRRPEAIELCREVGLEDKLVPIAARGASIWSRGRLRVLPEGHALGIPTRFWPTARSGILGVGGAVALARDALLPRPDVRGPIGDRAIGPLVARKLGRKVVDRLADPLIGGIHAGSVDDMSAAAVFPPLLAAAHRRGSLMRALRAEIPRPDPDGPPLFWAIEGGMCALVDALSSALERRGAKLVVSNRVEGLERDGGAWTLTGAHEVRADAIVLALPAPATALLLQPHDDEAAALLASIDYASVTVVTFRAPAECAPAELFGTGFLVPRRSAAKGRDPWAVSACTFLDRKWPHLLREGEILLRASLGRIDDSRADEWTDADCATRAWDELGALMGVTGAPSEWAVARHPRAFPQYRVHHLLRTAGVEAAAARLGRLAVAGSAFRGVGIPACIAGGRAAALAVS
ncbi:MAG TPA: protoporphyrinogen oxidase [Acidimicrobiales bacterium]|jgi:oxygen-dependent protoporphyrinogen oxidase|nr:protoporphyrinogen oxidase [Acidimicrobiales bacterium]